MDGEKEDKWNWKKGKEISSIEGKEEKKEGKNGSSE